MNERSIQKAIDYCRRDLIKYFQQHTRLSPMNDGNYSITVAHINIDNFEQVGLAKKLIEVALDYNRRRLK